MRHRPDLRRPPGADRILWPLVDRTRGGAPLQRNRLVGTSVTGECPRLHGAPAAFFLSPRGRTSGRACGMACQASLRAALAAVVAHRVQPSKADPRSGVGRLAGASRVRGYESRARAPHPAPPHETSPEDAPRSSETWRYNHTLGKTSILFLEKILERHTFSLWEKTSERTRRRAKAAEAADANRGTPPHPARARDRFRLRADALRRTETRRACEASVGGPHSPPSPTGGEGSEARRASACRWLCRRTGHRRWT